MGELLSLLAAALFALGGVFVRKGQRRQSADNGIFLSVLCNFLLTSIAMAAVALTMPLPPLVLAGVAFFVVAGVLTSFVGRGLYFTAVQHVGPSRAIGYRVTSPTFTLAAAMLLIGERLDLLPLLGFFGVIGGLWFLTQEVGMGKPAGPAPVGSQLPAYQPRLGVLFGMSAAASLGVGHALRKAGLSFVPNPIVGSWIGAAVALAGIVATFAARGSLWAVLKANLRPLHREYFIGGVLVSVGQILLFVAFFLAPVSLAAAVASTEPVWVLLFSRLVLGREERLGRRGLLAILGICLSVGLILAS